MASVSISPTYIGYDGSRSIYRVDLSSLGLATVGSFAIVDDGFKTGGVGGASGVDIDFLKISTNGAAAANTVKNLVGDNLFNFQGAVGFLPGYLTPWTVDKNPIWNTAYLFGTDPGNVYNPAKATFGVADGDFDASVGSLSFGEGGVGTFVLTSAIAASTPRYLYIGEYGDQNQGIDGFKVVVSSDAGVPVSYHLSLYGTPGVDSFIFGKGLNAHTGYGNDYINALAGNDLVYASFGNDTVYGGAGIDKLYGEYGNDGLYGQDGNDYIVAGAGHDKLYGGKGNDKLYGNAGKDVFVFDAKPHKSQNVDRIYDFKPKDDAFYLENSYFKVGKGSASKPLKIKADVFTIGTAAADAEDRLIYNKDNGALYYDPDGTGAKAMIKIAMLGKNLKLTYHDFFAI